MQQKQISKMQQEFIHHLFLRKTDLTNLKSDVDKLGIDKLKNVPLGFSNLRSKVISTCYCWFKIKNDVVKRNVYNSKIKNIEDKVTDITNLATATDLTAVENKVPNVSSLAKKLAITQILVKLRRKLLVMIMVNILLLQNLIS